jgi:transposase InsO family protein
VTRYRWVAARKAEGFPIGMACRTAQVSRQAFWDWRAKDATGPSQAERDETDLVAEIRRVHDDFDGTYGSPRVTEELARRGRPTNHKRVERLMRLHGIVGVHKAARVRTTIPAEQAPPLPDLIGRRFAPGRPDVAWVGDITYIPTGQGWLYLASVLDLGSRRLLGYSMADHMRTDLVADALRMAAGARGGVTTGIVFHGDRGSQYLSGEYRRLVRRLGMVQSVGRTGVCWDNSVAEAFWSSLKRELVHRYRFPDRAAARRAIFAWINRYNQRRLHSSLGYRPPLEWEQHYRQRPPQPGLAA